MTSSRATPPRTDRETLAAWMIEHGYATGHGDTTADLLRELEWQIVEREAVALDVDLVARAIHPEGEGPTIDCCMGSTVRDLYPPEEAEEQHRHYHRQAAARFVAAYARLSASPAPKEGERPDMSVLTAILDDVPKSVANTINFDGEGLATWIVSHWPEYAALSASPAPSEFHTEEFGPSPDTAHLPPAPKEGER